MSLKSVKCEELGAYKHTQTDQASHSLKCQKLELSTLGCWVDGRYVGVL